MHKIPWRLRLGPGPRWSIYSAPPGPLKEEEFLSLKSNLLQYTTLQYIHLRWDRLPEKIYVHQAFNFL